MGLLSSHLRSLLPKYIINAGDAFDDVTNLEGFAELIPPNHRFRILMTTRLRDIVFISLY
jgi:hypothetical protein